MEIKNLSEKAQDFTGNVWLIDGKEKVLVDAGTGDSWDQIKRLKNLEKVVITHSHYDHVDNLEKIVEKFGPDVYTETPGNLEVNAEKIIEGQTLNLSGTNFEVIKTPGHKDDSVCLYSKEKKILFTGDLIFPDGGFGRTDLDEGDRGKLIESIEKIAELEVEEFYPGHGKPVKKNAEKFIQESLENAKRREPKY